MSETSTQINQLSKEDLDKSKLSLLISKFKTANVMVVGDLILDEYLLGSPERISREAPVIVLNYIDSDYALGGGANAAANIASHKAQTTLLGLAGKDNGLFEIEALAKAKSINLDLVVDTERLTTIKTRISSTSNSNSDNGTVLKQQVLRVDRQSNSEISEGQELELFEKIQAKISETDVILLSDYSNGVLTESLVKKVIGLANKQGKKVVVDANGSFAKFYGADILTPNQPDAEAIVGYPIKTEADLIKAGADVLKLTNSQEVLITRGAKGMALFSKDNGAVKVDLLPAFNLSEVFDVTGAGDTVTATLALALAVGAQTIEAAILGNLAASFVVRKYGTATVDQEELLEVLQGI